MFFGLDFEVNAKLLSVIKEADFDEFYTLHFLTLFEIFFEAHLHIFNN